MASTSAPRWPPEPWPARPAASGSSAALPPILQPGQHPHTPLGWEAQHEGSCRNGPEPAAPSPGCPAEPHGECVGCPSLSTRARFQAVVPHHSRHEGTPPGAATTRGIGISIPRALRNPGCNPPGAATRATANVSRIPRGTGGRWGVEDERAPGEDPRTPEVAVDIPHPVGPESPVDLGEEEIGPGGPPRPGDLPRRHSRSPGTIGVQHSPRRSGYSDRRIAGGIAAGVGHPWKRWPRRHPAAAPAARNTQPLRGAGAGAMVCSEIDDPGQGNEGWDAIHSLRPRGEGRGRPPPPRWMGATERIRKGQPRGNTRALSARPTGRCEADGDIGVGASRTRSSRPGYAAGSTKPRR